jgi:hypothetical protein
MSNFLFAISLSSKLSMMLINLMLLFMISPVQAAPTEAHVAMQC